MRKVFLISFTVLTVASLSFAADFNPTVMTLTSPVEIEYQFDGSGLTIPFTVTGTPAALWLVINTKGKADTVVDVQNGYLGWHYVNKIDTTVYISDRYQREPGETTIVWDGNDQDGNALAADTYEYYLWGYDDVTPRQLACDYIVLGWDWESQYTKILEKGEDGLPLANPILDSCQTWWNASRHREEDDPAENPAWRYHGTMQRWIIGNDPLDLSFLQTTFCNTYSSINRGNDTLISYGGHATDPNDHSIFYQCCVNLEQKTDTMFKWQWVTDGEAIRDEDWLGWDELTWEESGAMIAMWSQRQAASTDGQYIYVVSPGLHQKELEWNRLRCVSFDGEVIFDKMLNEWYFPDDPNPHDYINGSFHNIGSRTLNHWLLVSHTSCLHEMIDTTRLLEDADDEEDMIIWQNANGDYFMDSAYEADVEPAWYCLADDKTTSMRRTSANIDMNDFNIIYTCYLGLTSFGVSTQDGTAIGYMKFADDSVSDIDVRKGTGLICDNGTNFDGLYMEAAFTETAGRTINANFVAFDSCNGIITNEPGQIAVEEEAQAAFAVAQNSPNPFNPTTSISFTIPGADHVTVEVYNVAGQKIDTLANDFMDAGKHSVVWDASGVSNGVYFYTVKSGDFSRTMKMTLLK